MGWGGEVKVINPMELKRYIFEKIEKIKDAYNGRN